ESPFSRLHLTDNNISRGGAIFSTEISFLNSKAIKIQLQTTSTTPQKRNRNFSTRISTASKSATRCTSLTGLLLVREPATEPSSTSVATFSPFEDVFGAILAAQWRDGVVDRSFSAQKSFFAA